MNSPLAVRRGGGISHVGPPAWTSRRFVFLRSAKKVGPLQDRQISRAEVGGERQRCEGHHELARCVQAKDGDRAYLNEIGR